MTPTFEKKITSITAVLRNFRYTHREYLKFGPIHRMSHGNYMLYKRLYENIIAFEDYCIVDVGASDGWLARTIGHFEKNKEIIAFEPLSIPKLVKGLEKVRAENKNFEYHHYAVGDKEGLLEITEYAEHGISSLKKLVNSSYNSKGYDTSSTSKKNVEVITLDNFFLKRKNTKKIILKVDTQGFEMEVLLGSQKLFEENIIDCVVIEISTIEKYKGQSVFPDFIDFFNKKDFILFDIHPFFYEEKGPLSEADYVFVNKNSELYKHLYN